MVEPFRLQHSRCGTTVATVRGGQVHCDASYMATPAAQCSRSMAALNPKPTAAPPGPQTPQSLPQRLATRVHMWQVPARLVRGLGPASGFSGGIVGPLPSVDV